MNLHPLFHLFLAIGVRTAIVCLSLMGGLRLLGKRQLGQMNIYDLALIMLVANAVQNAMTEGSGNLGAGMVSAGTLMFIGATLTYLFVRLPRLENRIVGVPTVIVRDGQLLVDAMRREHVTHDEVMQVLREHDICRIADVRMAVLETDGTLSVVPYHDGETADNSDEGIQTPTTPMEISDTAEAVREERD